jgi:hypothetical protein
MRPLQRRQRHAHGWLSRLWAACTVVSWPVDRIGDRVLQRANRFPLLFRPDDALRADLIDAPVDLQQMPVRIAELDDQLHARAAAAVEIDRNLVLTQMLANANDLIQCGHFHGDMVQPGAGGMILGRAEQCDRVMIRGAAEEHRAAGQFAGRDGVADLEAENIGVKPGRAFQVLHIHPNMADLADAERKPFRAAHGFNGVDVHGVSSCTGQAGEMSQAECPGQAGKVAGRRQGGGSLAHHASLTRCQRSSENGTRWEI